jgi:co-chaperonin GroES (HSP10)
MRTILEKVLIKVEEEIKGSIVIPDSVEKRPTKGIVIDRGLKVSEVKIGDRVIFRSGMPVEDGDEKFVVVYENDIIAIL